MQQQLNLTSCVRYFRSCFKLVSAVPRPRFVVLSPCKGYGYVTFKDKQGLLQALDMTPLSLNNRNLRVEVAKPQNRRGAQLLY